MGLSLLKSFLTGQGCILRALSDVDEERMAIDDGIVSS